jgi:hypothetical protein
MANIDGMCGEAFATWAAPAPREPDPTPPDWSARYRGEGPFPIGAVCAALGRPPVTIRLWSRQGHLPQAPQRLPTVNGVAGRRLYTRAQVEALIVVAERHGLFVRRRINWTEHPTFAAEVREAWAIRLTRLARGRASSRGTVERKVP